MHLRMCRVPIAGQSIIRIVWTSTTGTQNVKLLMLAEWFATEIGPQLWKRLASAMLSAQIVID
jgi:hypothetical protein